MVGERSDRPFDVVVAGASGYVGGLVAAELAAASQDRLRVALAGRRPDRLAAVAEATPGATGWARLRFDAQDPRSCRAVAEQARVVVTTVGPYQRLGFALAEACAESGTDYCDLTGEVLFVRRCVDELHERAVRQGCRLVHACGYDSVPSDLAVLLAASAAQDEGTGALAEAILVARARGGLSGGTIDSYRAQLEALAADPGGWAVVLDPYALSPSRALEPDLGDQPDRWPPRWSDLAGGWVAPFVMAPFNTRIVRRSNALLGHAWGRALRYQEATGGRPGATGLVEAGGLAAAQGLALRAFEQPRIRRLLDRLLPAPGQGPSAAARRAGWFRSVLHARTVTGARYESVVAGTGDPGYAATAVMLTEAALALAEDRDHLPEAAGVLTPATALGWTLVERLRRRGMTLAVTRRG
ncbi:saccharopine dehydrogenase family protein [Aciditerrimonas ferrireducens]|uniref:Saccharopine dehydrogenase family protein n=1 Tax=Aciditerrimonas ferrireducens TaxID=667306 RepID=A0ABV6C3V5_9ACTN